MLLSDFIEFVEALDIPFIEGLDGRTMQNTPKTLTGLSDYDKKWVCNNVGPLEKQLLLINNKTMIMLRYTINDLRDCKKKMTHLSDDEMRYAIWFRLSNFASQFIGVYNHIDGKTSSISKEFARRLLKKISAYMTELMSVFEEPVIPEGPKTVAKAEPKAVSEEPKVEPKAVSEETEEDAKTVSEETGEEPKEDAEAVSEETEEEPKEDAKTVSEETEEDDKAVSEDAKEEPKEEPKTVLEEPKKPVPISVKNFMKSGRPLHTFGKVDEIVRPIPRYNGPFVPNITTEAIAKNLVSRFREIQRPGIIYLLP